jgi:MOSC domain-containing protein YiiM
MLYSCIGPGAAVAKVEARVTHLFVKPAHGVPMEARAAVHAVEDKGLTGDAAFGTFRRQVLVIDDQTLASFNLAPGMVRENITVSGVAMRGLPRGARIRIGEVVLEVAGDCTPCDYLDSLRPGLRAAIVGQRGLLTRVARSGELRIGAPVQIEISEAISDPRAVP